MRGLSGRQQLGPRHNCFSFLRVRGGGFVLVLGQGGVFFVCLGPGKNGTESEEGLWLFLCSLMMFMG